MNSNVSKDIEVCNETITLLSQISKNNLTVGTINTISEKDLSLLCGYIESREDTINYSELQKINFDKIMKGLENIQPNADSPQNIKDAFTKKTASLVLLNVYTEDIKKEQNRDGKTKETNKNIDMGFGN